MLETVALLNIFIKKRLFDEYKVQINLKKEIFVNVFTITFDKLKNLNF